jgi:hypothetical protein
VIPSLGLLGEEVPSSQAKESYREYNGSNEEYLFYTSLGAVDVAFTTKNTA